MKSVRFCSPFFNNLRTKSRLRAKETWEYAPHSFASLNRRSVAASKSMPASSRSSSVTTSSARSSRKFRKRRSENDDGLLGLAVLVHRDTRDDFGAGPTLDLHSMDDGLGCCNYRPIKTTQCTGDAQLVPATDDLLMGNQFWHHQHTVGSLPRAMTTIRSPRNSASSKKWER